MRFQHQRRKNRKKNSVEAEAEPRNTSRESELSFEGVNPRQFRTVFDNIE